MGKFSISARLASRVNKDGTHAIIITYTYDRVTKDFQTSIAVTKDNWDSKKKLVALTSSDAVKFNNLIQEKQALLHKVATELSEPTHELVKYNFTEQAYLLSKQKVDPSFKMMPSNDVRTMQDLQDLTIPLKERLARDKKKKPRVEKEESIIEIEPADKDNKLFFDLQAAYIRELKLSKSVKAGTLKQRQSLFSNLRKFQEDTGFILTFQKINLDFYQAYGDWVLFTGGNYDNFFGSLIKRLKTWLTWVEEERQIAVNSRYKKFKVLREEFDVTYLNDQELQWLDEFRNHPTCKPSWIRIIDMTLFQCSIGCRWSDLEAANWYFDNGFLKGHTIKNDSAYMVPLNSSKWIKEILLKYNMTFKLPVRHSEKVEVISDVKYNKYIKDILKAMYASKGMYLDEADKKPVLKKRWGKLVQVGREFKWESISSHSNRRSFIGRMIKQGMSEKQIAKMVGSSSLPDLRKYYKVDEEDLLNAFQS